MTLNKYISEIFEYRISKVALRDDDILHIVIKPDEIFTKLDFLDLLDAAFKIGNGRRFLNLIEVGEHTTADAEAREMSASIEGSVYKIADAFVIYSLPQKIVGNFYMSFNKPIVPTHFHTSEEEAYNWLQKIKVETYN